MSDVVWHYHEMGNPYEADRLRPWFNGVTRQQAETKYAHKLAIEQFPSSHWNTAKIENNNDIREVLEKIITPDFVAKNYPKRYFIHHDEAVYFLTAPIWHATQHYPGVDWVYADEMAQDEKWYVMITRDERVFVSPAEGGCYDTVSHFIKWTYFDTKEKARNFVRAYNLEAMKMRMGGDHSMLGGDDTVSSMYPEGYIPTGWVAEKCNSAQLVILPFVPERQPWRYE